MSLDTFSKKKDSKITYSNKTFKGHKTKIIHELDFTNNFICNFYVHKRIISKTKHK